ncbi:hypothetical protein GE09DRAFT_221249 [Coniochaeta sp. 2T2.1]|nr:hypothetical protein GE09DRAFT_221249 [Coniochaeta sp. 2T2.1]
MQKSIVGTDALYFCTPPIQSAKATLLPTGSAELTDLTVKCTKGSSTRQPSSSSSWAIYRRTTSFVCSTFPLEFSYGNLTFTIHAIMKLIITGASGFVATELIRQSLKRPDITAVVALSRKAVSPPSDAGANASKLRSVVVKDYDEYPEDVRKEFEGASACIWTVAITPTKSRLHDFNYVKKICQEGTELGLKTMYESRPAKPFRFLYMSGVGAVRSRDQTPQWMPEYSWMRGETENRILAFAAAHPGEVEASTVKPGSIVTPGRPITTIFAKVANQLGMVSYIDLGVIATAMLEQVINGFDSDALLMDDLKRIAAEKGVVPSPGKPEFVEPDA